MQTPSDSPVPTPRAKLSGGRLVLGCVTIGLVLMVIVIAAGVSWWLADNYKAEKELAVEVKKVRGRGDPLTTVELNDFYVAAPNRPDMTAQILTAIELCNSPGLSPQANALPIVGTGPNVPEPPAEWPQLAEAEAYLNVLQPALDIFHDVARQDGTARFPADYSMGASVKLEHVQMMRGGARALSLQCQVDLHHDRPHEAVENIIALVALARTLDQEPCLIAHLVRIAIHSMAIRDMQLAMRAVQISDEDLVRLQQALRKIGVESNLRRALAGEGVFGYMACVDMRAMNGLTPQEAKEIAGRTPQRRYDAAMILRNNNRIIEASEAGLADAIRVAHDVEDELADLMKSTPNRIIFMMSAMMTPAYSRGVEAFARSASQRDLADAAIAAERFRRQHGKWPDKLEQLVPDFLPAAPVDPFNNQPLKLIATPVEFKVYSVGQDGKDDGGDISGDNPADIGFAIPLRKGERAEK